MAEQVILATRAAQAAQPEAFAELKLSSHGTKLPESMRTDAAAEAPVAARAHDHAMVHAFATVLDQTFRLHVAGR